MSDSDKGSETNSAVQESGENGKVSAQQNTASIPLQRQENDQETVCAICLTARGIRGPWVGAMDTGQQTTCKFWRECYSRR